MGRNLGGQLGLPDRATLYGTPRRIDPPNGKRVTQIGASMTLSDMEMQRTVFVAGVGASD